MHTSNAIQLSGPDSVPSLRSLGLVPRSPASSDLSPAGGALNDVDLGVHFPQRVLLAVLSRLSPDLEQAAARGVDIAGLARRWMRGLALAHRITGEMQPLTIDDEEALVRFRRQSSLEYMEAEPLPRSAHDSLRARVAAARAGYRHYLR